MELVFIRHGETAGNRQRRYIGQAESLSAEGRHALLERVAAGKYPAVQAVYTSPLRRCEQTARLLYPAATPIAISDLTELNFGAFEGKTYDQLKDDPAYRRWIDTAGMSAPPNGEGGQAFAERLCAAMRQVAEHAVQNGVARAAVITHGGCLMSLLSSLGEGLSAEDFYRFQVGCGGGFTAQMDADTLVLREITPLA